ncbi:hypothetical protein [Rhodohalobacter sp.]|uniref:hypothetical protein n=1 Tax=Rhodohalobacter sp. TaxID=1974210 RepID=UPI003565A485
MYFTQKVAKRALGLPILLKYHNGNSHLVSGIYRVSRKEFIPESTTVVYNPYRITENLALIGEPHEFEWIND